MRWSPNGDMIATASADTECHENVALLDFKTGKRLYPGKVINDCNFFRLGTKQ